MRTRTAIAALAVSLSLAWSVSRLGAQADPSPGAELSVVFVVNDALVKDRLLEGVEVQVRPSGSKQTVAVGTTDADGRWSARLAAGTYTVSYRLAGHVPYTSEATEVRGDGQLVTVSLSPVLEATGEAARQVRVILNWGSQADQVRDVDSHLACPCQEPLGHVYYQAKVHQAEGHTVALDVDDTDWGGPETVTLTDPPPGSYLYWVHDYSAGPGSLGSSDVVVRVLIGDQEAGQFRVFKGVTTRAWRPFKAIEVSPAGEATVVRFTQDETAEGLDLQVRPDLQPPQPPASSGTEGSSPAISLSREMGQIGYVLVGLVVAAFMYLRRRSRRRRRSK